MLDTLRHLLPDSTAWRLVVERTLKKYLRGVATVGSDVVAFVDDVYDDLWPDLTRELDEWLKQFGISRRAWLNDDDVLRDYLDFRWGEDRGQSPKHLQDKLRAAGFTGAYVYESFDPTDLELTTYTGDSTGLVTDDPKGFCFANGGTKLYVAGDITYNVIDQYTLSSPYDLSSATFDSVSFVTTTQDDAPHDVKLNPDGTKMFVLGEGFDAVYEYDLPTPFSVAGAQYVDSMSISAKEATAMSFHWKPDGTEVYIVGRGSDDVHQYTLGTAWDVSTGGFTRTYDPSIVDPDSITFNEAGTQMFIMPLADTSVQMWNLSTPWDISSATTSGQSLTMSSEDTQPQRGVLVNGLFFMLGLTSDRIYRYRYGAWRDPLDYADQPRFGNTQCGEPGTGPLQAIPECGEEPPDQNTIDSATCSRLLANEVWYLVNQKLNGEAPPSIPTDSSKWGPLWYVGGSPIGTELEVADYDRARFEKICLHHGPAEDYIVTILDVWETNLISTWEYEISGSAPSTGAFRFGPQALYIHDLDVNGTDQGAALATIVVGTRLRYVSTADGSWSEYVTDVAAFDEGGYWSLGFNPIYIAQSSDWTGFPGAGVEMQIYHRKSV